MIIFFKFIMLFSYSFNNFYCICIYVFPFLSNAMLNSWLLSFFLVTVVRNLFIVSSKNWLLFLLIIINFCFCIYFFFPAFYEFTLSQTLPELTPLFFFKSFNIWDILNTQKTKNQTPHPPVNMYVIDTNVTKTQEQFFTQFECVGNWEEGFPWHQAILWHQLGV